MSPRKELLRIFDNERTLIDDRVKDGIESFRKGFGIIHLQDSEGKPVPGAKIKISQKTHDFKHGANLFLLDEFDSPEQNKIYEDRFADAFNLATLAFYWKDLEPEKGKPRFAKDSPKIYRRPAPDLCLEYCEKRGIEPKAHCLNYSCFAPEWAKGTVEYEKAMLDKRFRELAERYASKIPMWEVTNETYWGWKSKRAQNFYNEPDFVEWSFETAKRYFPLNSLVINEGTSLWSKLGFHGNRSSYYMQIERALAKGAKIDSIGMQFHMFFRAKDELEKGLEYYNADYIFSIMDIYGRLGIPLQITEITIPAYSTEKEDEEIQAEIIRNLYSMWFAHPAMEAIIYWNLVDGYTYGKKGDMNNGENYYHGGLLRYDLTPKPAYNVIRELFEKTWRTNTCTESNADGKALFKGFFGIYDLEIEANGKTVSKSIHLNKNRNMSAEWTFTL